MGFKPGSSDQRPFSSLENPSKTSRQLARPPSIVNNLRVFPSRLPRPAFEPRFEPWFRAFVRKCQSVTSPCLKHLFTMLACQKPHPKQLNPFSSNELKSYETVSHDLCTSYSQVSVRTTPLPETLLNTAISRSRHRGPIVNKWGIPPASPLIGPSGKGRIRPLERILRPESAGSRRGSSPRSGRPRKSPRSPLRKRRPRVREAPTAATNGGPVAAPSPASISTRAAAAALLPGSAGPAAGCHRSPGHRLQSSQARRPVSPIPAADQFEVPAEVGSDRPCASRLPTIGESVKQLTGRGKHSVGDTSMIQGNRT